MLSQVLEPLLVENDTMLISGGRQPKDTPINNWLTHLQALYQNKFQKYLVNANLFKKVSAVSIFIFLIFSQQNWQFFLSIPSKHRKLSKHRYLLKDR